jgi:hypothetical protein
MAMWHNNGGNARREATAAGERRRARRWRKHNGHSDRNDEGAHACSLI